MYILGCSTLDATHKVSRLLFLPPDEIDSLVLRRQPSSVSLSLRFLFFPSCLPLQRHADSPVAEVFLLDHSVALNTFRTSLSQSGPNLLTNQPTEMNEELHFSLWGQNVCQLSFSLCHQHKCNCFCWFLIIGGIGL